MPTMKALRVHRQDEPFVVEDIPVPSPGAGEVLVDVRAVAILPNMVVLLARPDPFPIIRPPTPYTLGSGGATGIVAAVGTGVDAFKAGDRVFLTEVLSCGTCDWCRQGCRNYCNAGGEMGLFAYSDAGIALLAQYPNGAMAEYVTVPAHNLARLPEPADLDRSVRLGYWSIAYRGMRNAGLEPGMTVAAIGATGSMGIGATFAALAMGASRIFAIAKSRRGVEELSSVDPARIVPLSVEEGEIAARIRADTDGHGVDFVIDTQGFVEPTTTQEVLGVVGKGGKVALVGGVQGDLTLRYDWLVWWGTSVSGSLNYQIGDVEDLARMMAAGQFPTERIQIKAFGLDGVEEALQGLSRLPGIFWSHVIHP